MTRPRDVRDAIDDLHAIAVRVEEGHEEAVVRFVSRVSDIAQWVPGLDLQLNAQATGLRFDMTVESVTVLKLRPTRVVSHLRRLLLGVDTVGGLPEKGE